jgi:hypothetical protein
LPKWNFDDATFNRSAAAFDNEDHVSIVIHNYRWRLGLAEGEALNDDLERQFASGRHHRAHHHSRRRCQWRTPSGSQRLGGEILGQVRDRTISGGIGQNTCRKRHLHAFAEAIIDADSY